MNSQTEKQYVPFLSLKDDENKEVYVIDRADNDLVISPKIPFIDIHKTLTLYDDNSNEICKINMGNIIVNAIVDAIENSANSDTDYGKIIDDRLSLYSGLISFREIDECFPSLNVNSYSDIGRKTYVSLCLPMNESNKNGTTEFDPEPSRNLPCPCGSGKKYKRCCGAPKE